MNKRIVDPEMDFVMEAKIELDRNGNPYINIGFDRTGSGRARLKRIFIRPGTARMLLQEITDLIEESTAHRGQ